MKKLIAVVLVITLLASCLCACAPVGLTVGGLGLLLSQCTAVEQYDTVQSVYAPEVFVEPDVFDYAEDVFEDVEDVFEDVEDIFDF